jgi:hypothetical protein
LNDKRLKRNISGDTNSLSFRNLSHLVIIDEEKIQKQSDGELLSFLGLYSK